ncbi:MAG TPA: hypothetical protein DHW02_17815, partial [Ktedonobacter sp.]|nr:hypothetical protein [Ktedonobacter sp.]
NWQYRENNSNIEEEYLRPFLVRQGYSETLITRAIEELRKVASDQARSLYDINRAVYDLLRYGVKMKPNVSANTQTVYLIDWERPLNNDFGIAEEVSVKGEKTKRPDIVLYVNGIALAVLELKRSTVPVSDAIRQNIGNQLNEFIRPFFTTIQFALAGNDTEGLRYGTIETSEKYYLTWKEDVGTDSSRPSVGDTSRPPVGTDLSRPSVPDRPADGRDKSVPTAVSNIIFQCS